MRNLTKWLLVSGLYATAAACVAMFLSLKPTLRRHPALMAIAFVLLIPAASTSWRVFSTHIPRTVVKAVHVMVMTVSMVLAVLGFADAYSYKDAMRRSHFDILHSWLGLATLSIFSITYLGIAGAGGILTCNAPTQPPSTGSIATLHTSVGLASIGGGFLSVCTGVLALVGDPVFQSTIEGDVLNAAGVMAFVVGLIMLLVMRHNPMHYGAPIRHQASRRFESEARRGDSCPCVATCSTSTSSIERA